MTRNNQPRSIAFMIFKKRLSSEMRTFWYCRTAFEYAERWWNEESRKEEFAYTTKYPGDDNQLYRSIDIPPQDYISQKDDRLWSVRGNTITNIVTAFETYLYYQTKRAIYIKPSLLAGSGIEMNAGEVADSFYVKDQKEWFADKVVSKYIRNNSHSKMIKKIDKLIQGGLTSGQEQLISRWTRKVTLRNALIHNAKLVNNELVEEWSDKFERVGVPIEMEDNDVIRTQYVAHELAMKIDEQFNRTVVDKEDAILLARVAYLSNRELTLGQIVDCVSKVLNYRFSKDLAESAIAYQNRTREHISDFTIMEEIVQEFFASS